MPLAAVVTIRMNHLKTAPAMVPASEERLFPEALPYMQAEAFPPMDILYRANGHRKARPGAESGCETMVSAVASKPFSVTPRTMHIWICGPVSVSSSPFLKSGTDCEPARYFSMTTVPE